MSSMINNSRCWNDLKFDLGNNSQKRAQQFNSSKQQKHESQEQQQQQKCQANPNNVKNNFVKMFIQNRLYLKISNIFNLFFIFKIRGNLYERKFSEKINYFKQIDSNISTNLWTVFVVLFILSSFSLDYVDAHQISSIQKDIHSNYHPKQEFSNYYIISPKIHHGRHKRALTNTLESESGFHANYIILSYKHNGESVIADLKLNEDLIPENHFLRYQKPNDNGVEVKNLTKHEVDLCHYQGKIRGNPNSHVALSTCHGINGVVFDQDDTYYIYAGKDGRIHDNHYLLRHSDIKTNATCGFSDGEDHSIHSHDFSIPSEYNRILRYKRSTSDNILRGPYNANKHSSFVELVMVIDNKVYKAFGENMKKVHNHCKDIANIVNALYVPLNIFIALVGVVVWNEANEIDLPSDGDATLKNFLHYRRKVLVKDHPNDNAQLLTKEQFAGGVVGKALKGPICTYEYSGGVSMEHSPIVAVVATTVAHEMGHNFGMEHDTTDCKCVDDKCIMSASSTSVVPRHWSSCSIDQLNVAFSHGMNYCLRNRPTKLFESPQCGNGFVEQGEQCDCGLPEFCENTCCDPNTCMLHTNASCATGECCDLTTCRPHSAGTKCRPADGECDLPEYCTGESEYCPADVYKRDTEPCDGGNTFCFQGTCRSRSNQCKILWGPSGESSDHCYEKNVEGTRHGNCGYDRLNTKYIQCLEEDVFCGMLHCRHLNERLEFGMESVAVLSHSFMSRKGNIIPCRNAIVDLGLDSTDPGLTPNGAKCGEGKMCVNQKCMAVESLQIQGQGVKCAEDCNGQGVCNSKGHCHCFDGFSPPFCNNPGPGGSEDSGPATNPNVRLGFTRAMYIFFLGVVPLVSLLLLFAYYWKQNRPLKIRKTSNVAKAAIKVSNSRGSSSPPGGPPTSTPSSTDDMNSALLRSPTESDTSLLNNNMFGKFKGFTLRPLPNAAGGTNLGGANVAFVHPVSKVSEDQQLANGVPIRLAPPVPKPPTLDVKPTATIKQNGTLPHMKNLQKTENAAPALPPPNPGFTARPIISNPVLEASTCTAKELISPLKTTGSVIAPSRPAPPPHAPGFIPMKSDTLPKTPAIDKKPKEGTVKKIASFLKKEDKPELSAVHLPKLKPVIDREKLKNIEISAPIPVVDNNSDSEQTDNRQLVSRTQSMRDPSVSDKKAALQSFGSMRQPVSRPKSMVGIRPKSPPPRPPAPPVITNMKIPGVPGYQNPPEPKKDTKKSSLNEYDDCEAIETSLSRISERNSPTGSDNIYSVIEERPQENSGTTISSPPIDEIPPDHADGMGLLGEIVNEIEKRNVDSIYSASTLKKKKPTPEGGTLYANTSEKSDYSDGDYYKSNGSTTSSGYLRPSAINTPVARVAPTKPDLILASKSTTNNALSSFKPKTTLPTKTTKGKDEQKPAAIASSNKTPTSNASTNNNAKFNNTRTKLNTNSNLNKANSDSVRRRSPSPGGALSKSIGTGKTKVVKNSPVSARKNSSNDIQNNTTIGTKSAESNNSQSQKPKPLVKPALSSKSSSVGSNSGNVDNAKFVRQNSNASNSGTGTGTRRTKSTNNQDNETNKNANSRINNSVNNSSNNSSSNSASKILNAASRPTPGKLSNVASLQQKFETNPINKSNNFSLSNNSASSLKK